MKHKQWVMGAALASLWACGSPEQATVEQFFRASQSNDSPTVAAMSAVSAPGTVESWEVVEVTSQTTEPFALPGLVEQLSTAEKDRTAMLEEGREYMAEYQDVIDQITEKTNEDPEFMFTGDNGEIQVEWTRLLEGRKETERAYQEAKRAVDTLTNLANKSLLREVNLEEYGGDVAVTKMEFMLKLEGAEPKPYTVELHKYDLSGPQSDTPESSRWIIVDIQEKA